jgi:hypothetical protein
MADSSWNKEQCVTLVPFPDTWAGTARALHEYSRVIGAIPRAHADPQPNWWHIGLIIEGQSLVTVPVPLPDGGSLRLGMAPARHMAWMQTTGDEHAEFAMDAGVAANDFADQLFGRVAALGLAGDYDRSRFASDESHPYDREAATAYWGNLTAIAGVLERRRAEMEGEPGPVHLWTHHFDLSFEWYGTRSIEGEDGTDSLGQINLGFNVLDEQYLYSSPWPFDDSLTGAPLPGPARWHTEGWNGSMVPYEALVGRIDWEEFVLEYARAVFTAARPTIMA